MIGNPVLKIVAEYDRIPTNDKCWESYCKNVSNYDLDDRARDCSS